MADFRIGDYDYTIIDSGNRYVRAETWDKTKVAYEALSSTVEYDGVIYTLTNINACFSYCIFFNQSIEVPNSVTYMNDCFRGCTSFNQPIEIPDSVINMEGCFYNCTSFNQSIEIPNSVTYMKFCFLGCTSFNQSIEIPNSVTNIRSCFLGCTSFNQPIEIPDSVINMEGCFHSCISFNQSIEIPNSVTNIRSCFGNCESFNQYILCFNKPISYDGIFNYTEKDITIIAIGEDNYSTWKTIVENDSPKNVHIPNSFSFEYGDYRYTKTPLDFRVKAIRQEQVEYGEILKTYINNKKITSMSYCFSNCTFFNQSIEIPDSVKSISFCFNNCTSFNQSIKIPDSVTNMAYCFYRCTSFNQSIEIPDSVTNMSSCFNKCTSLGADIKVRKIIQKTEDAFLNTSKDIYIINEAEPSSKEEVAKVWREVANERPNVHYELDDHPSPALELEVRRVDERSKPSTSGTYALVNLKYTISNSFVPYDYPAPSLESESLVLDNIRTIPLTEKRDYLINKIDDNQHVFVYTVSDGYRTSTITRILSRVLALLDFQGDSGKDYVDKPGMGMAIGTIATRNGLAIQFPVAIGDELLPATKEVYTLTTDTEFNPEKKYYEKDGDDYVLTEDTEFIDGKKYYEKRKAVDLDNYQLIIGQYNKEDKTKAFIIGNGEVNEGVVRRSNVFTIDWNGNTVAKSLKLISDAGKEAGLRLTNDGKTNAKFGWDTDNREGAGFSLRNADYPVEGEEGCFVIWADNGDKRFLLKGKPDGQLTWKDRLIPYGQGTKITPTFRQCTNGAYTTCRKIGNLVILSFNINVTTATADYDYLTGLPNAVDAFAGSSAIGTSAGRWWVTGNGTLRFDGTPTTGWHNGNITYICQ